MSDYNRKLRFGVIAEDASNITHDTAPNAHTVYIDNENHLAVKRDNYGEHWKIKESIKNKIREEYNQSVQGTIKKRYGFKLDMNEADPMSAVEYTHDAVGFTPISFTDLRSSCDYGSWYDFIKNFIGCRPVALYEDGTVYRYLQDDDYTKDLDGNTIEIELGKNIDPAGKIYNIMVEFSQKWYHIWNDENGYLYFEIANYKVDDDWCCDAFLGPDGLPKEYLYMSAYFTQRQYLNGEAVYSSCKYKSNGESVENIQFNSYSFYKHEQNLEIQNKYVFGYSQYMYFRMIMILICKSCLITAPYGVMDPLNTLKDYTDPSLTHEHQLYGNYKANEQWGEKNDTSKVGLFFLDKDSDDNYKNTQSGTSILREKILGIDSLLSLGGEFIYGFAQAYQKKDVFYKPNPPYYFQSNITQEIYNTAIKHYIEYDASSLIYHGSNFNTSIKTLKACDNIILPGNFSKFNTPYSYTNSTFLFYLPSSNISEPNSSQLGDILTYGYTSWWFFDYAVGRIFSIRFDSVRYACNQDNTNYGSLKRFIQFS